MNDVVFAGNKALYMILMLSALPILIATTIGLLVGFLQTVTQLQEQTLPFGVKLLCICVFFFVASGWYSETILAFGYEVLHLALARK